MMKLMLTGAGSVIAVALLSAVVMIANAPAESRPILDPVLPSVTSPDSTMPEREIGRLTLTFEPASEAVDRY